MYKADAFRPYQALCVAIAARTVLLNGCGAFEFDHKGLGGVIEVADLGYDENRTKSIIRIYIGIKIGLWLDQIRINLR